MMVTSSRRPSTRKTTSLFSSQRQQSQAYEQSSGASDLESDEFMEEEAIAKRGDSYQSEDEEIDAELDEMMEDDDDEYIEIESRLEEGEEEIEQAEEEDAEQAEEPEEENEQENSYESRAPTTRRTRGNRGIPRRAPQKQKRPMRQQKVPTQHQTSNSRKNMAESSSSSHDARILTKRQRAKLDDNYGSDLLQLPMEPMKKKQLTEEEMLLKKSEIARRRKHQSIQRAEQDKMDTINRLLKKQASKKRSKDQDETDSISKDDSSTNSQTPIAFHYVSNKDGCTLSIPSDVEIPIKFSKGPNYPPPVPICSVSGCTRPKKYRC
ncbi:12423_t:CDS:2, partial [Cetraspora pellucida]